MGKYLSKTGLARVWSKLKGSFASSKCDIMREGLELLALDFGNYSLVDSDYDVDTAEDAIESVIDNKVSGKQDTLTAGDNITISGTTISAKDTTYSAATTSAAGLMSASDKMKLDGVATGATNTVVAVTQDLSSGTNIATINISGTATKLYAPSQTEVWELRPTREDAQKQYGLNMSASGTNQPSVTANLYMSASYAVWRTVGTQVDEKTDLTTRVTGVELTLVDVEGEECWTLYDGDDGVTITSGAVDISLDAKSTETDNEPSYLRLLVTYLDEDGTAHDLERVVRLSTGALSLQDPLWYVLMGKRWHVPTLPTPKTITLGWQHDGSVITGGGTLTVNVRPSAWLDVTMAVEESCRLKVATTSAYSIMCAGTDYGQSHEVQLFDNYMVHFFCSTSTVYLAVHSCIG